jgi:hypothetical protein
MSSRWRPPSKKNVHSVRDVIIGLAKRQVQLRVCKTLTHSALVHSQMISNGPIGRVLYQALNEWDMSCRVFTTQVDYNQLAYDVTFYQMTKSTLCIRIVRH